MTKARGERPRRNLRQYSKMVEPCTFLGFPIAVTGVRPVGGREATDGRWTRVENTNALNRARIGRLPAEAV